MKIDLIGRAIHDGWWQFMLMHGWRLGPRNAKAKTHPHLVHWELLDKESRAQDRRIANGLLMSGRDLNAVTPEDIHEAWCAWDRRRSHPHNKPFDVAHPLNAGEHWLQSILIRALAPTLPTSPAKGFIANIKAVRTLLQRFEDDVRANPEAFAEIDDILALTKAMNETQNACIQLNHAVSIVHSFWLAVVHPEIKKPGPTDWIEHERCVQELLNPMDLPAVLSDIDTTP
jgi:hypothetical protein